MPNPLVRRRIDLQVPWLLRDDFGDDRAAGAVNGVWANPGPGGARTIVDTNNKISLSGGLLSVDAGAALNDGVWHSSMTRLPGRMVIFPCTAVGATSSPSGGWATGAGVAINDRAGPYGTAIYIAANGGTAAPVGACVVGTKYSLAGIMRSVGIFWFIRGGIYTTWTLLSLTSAGNAAGIPAFQNREVVATSLALTADFIRVPEQLWLPTPIASDSFNRANGALGNTDAAGHADGNGGGGGLTWTNQIGTVQVSTNTAMATVLAGGVALATVDTGSINVLHEAALTRGTGTVGIALRYAGATSYVYAVHTGANAQLHKVTILGGDTTLIDAAAAYVAGAVLRVISDGTSFFLFYNNARVGTTQTIADAELQTGTAHGLYYTDTDSSLDSVVVWERAGAQYQILDQFCR